jgi:ligand-binding SRPBCC domain-containing protein
MHIFRLHDAITIHAPIERCFQLSTHLALVEEELGMTPVASGTNRTSGMVQANDTVLWKGWKFGLPQHHQSLIEAFDAPNFFRDRMLRGRFKSFEHDHALKALDANSTELTDDVRYSLPFGPLGKMAGKLILSPHIRRLMQSRFERIKQLAESDGWQQYLSPPATNL